MAARKRPFDIDVVLRRIREAVAPYPDAAMFALRDEGYGTLFQQLVACIISIRTTDEVSLPTALALLKRAPTPAAMARMTVSDIDAIIHASSFTPSPTSTWKNSDAPSLRPANVFLS